VALSPVFAPSWPCPLKSRGGAPHDPTSPQAPHPTRLPRLLPFLPFSTVAGPTPLPVRPWPEVKSRRGAPKRINTEGFACPNHLCPYFGITDAHIHALVGDGKHGHAEQIQTFRCQVCHTTFSARRHTPLYCLKTPSHQVAMVLTALAEGLDASAAERASVISRPPSPRGSPAQAGTLRSSMSAPSATSTSRTSSWTKFEPGYAAPHRCSGCGWPSILSPRFCPCFIWVPAHTMSSTRLYRHYTRAIEGIFSKANCSANC
jgi:hypothetical protein